MSVVVVTPIEGSIQGGAADETQTDEHTAANAQVDADSVQKDPEGQNDAPQSEEEKVIIGLICDIKNLFKKVDMHNQVTWSDKCPTDLEEAAENEETQKFAILVRNSKSLPIPEDEKGSHV